MFTVENAIRSYVFANVIIAFSFFTINCNFYLNLRCVKSIQIRSFFWTVLSCIRTRKNYVFDTFHAVLGISFNLKTCLIMILFHLHPMEKSSFNTLHWAMQHKCNKSKIRGKHIKHKTLCIFSLYLFKKKEVNLQSFTKYLRLTLVFM